MVFHTTHHATSSPAPSGNEPRGTAGNTPYRSEKLKRAALAALLTGGILAATSCSKDDSESESTSDGNTTSDMTDSTTMTTNNAGFGFGQNTNQNDQTNTETTTATEGTPVFDDNREVTPIESPTTTTCGGNVCSDRLIFGDTALQPCCTGSNDDDCGLETGPLEFMAVQSQCADLAAPGSEDDACPSLDYDDTVTTTNLPGCCMPNGVCGVVADLLLVADFGCVDPREFFDLPEQVADMYGGSCEGSELDAGTASAGDAEDGSDASVADE